MSTTAKRHPRYDEDRRVQALAVYREEGSYRKAATRLGCSPKRARELVQDALRLEIAEARANEEGETKNA